jgi:soluble epoxide hydrolase / lipid-phosphate phosphatase
MTGVFEYALRTARHTTGYLGAGPEDGPVIMFLHGWPELSRSWRHQLPVFAGLGFRVIAPDMRGYGRSSTYASTDAYSQEQIVADMIELVDHLGVERAVWVGHDWGGPVVWNIASHHPERCHGVAVLCVPYRTVELGLDALVGLVDRRMYPADEYPHGQWDYMVFHRDRPDRVAAVLGADPYRTVKALFRKGKPEDLDRPAPTASITRWGGWFRGADVAPDLPRDVDVVSEADLRVYAAALARNGFLGPDAWYLNHEANVKYSARAVDGGRLRMPALFLGARYDTICEVVNSRLAEPQREYVDDLTERLLDGGHWMAQERPAEVNAAVVAWLRDRLPAVWPATGVQAGR